MFKDIKNSETWESIKKVSKGWSSDNKYFIKTKDGKCLLLRISDIEQYSIKQKEYEIIKKYSEIAKEIEKAPFSKPYKEIKAALDENREKFLDELNKL